MLIKKYVCIFSIRYLLVTSIWGCRPFKPVIYHAVCERERAGRCRGSESHEARQVGALSFLTIGINNVRWHINYLLTYDFYVPLYNRFHRGQWITRVSGGEGALDTPGPLNGTSEWLNVCLQLGSRVIINTVRHVTGNDKDYLRKIPRVVW